MLLGLRSSNQLWDGFEGVRRFAAAHSVGAGSVIVLRRIRTFGSPVEVVDGADARSDVERIAAGAAIVLVVALPMLDLARVASVPEWSGRLVPAVIAVVGSVPLQLRLLVSGLRNERAPHAGSLLIGLALLHLGAAILVGPAWLPNFALLVVSILFVIPGYVGPLAAVGAVLLAAGLAGSPTGLISPSYIVFAIAWRSATLLVLVQLVAAVRRLDAARRELRDRAVVRERIRIDGELRNYLGRSLDDIALRAVRASDALERDESTAAEEVRSLIDESRATLGRARRLVTRYQDASVAAELQASRALLEAAGVETRILIADDHALEATDEDSLGVIRAAVIDVLRDDFVTLCVLEIGHEVDGGVRVGVSTEPPAGASPRVGRR